jgi:hypothetical protein
MWRKLWESIKALGRRITPELTEYERDELKLW